VTRISIDVDVLNRAGYGLRTTASAVTAAARLAGDAQLTHASFGTMNAALAPRINRLVEQSRMLIEATGDLLDHLGRTVHDDAVSWARTEREIAADLRTFGFTPGGPGDVLS
jgi:hypothetical protein